MTSPDICREHVARNLHGISQPNFVPAPQANINPLISYNQPQQESSAFSQHGNILGPPLPIHPQILHHTPVPRDLYPGLSRHAILIMRDRLLIANNKVMVQLQVKLIGLNSLCKTLMLAMKHVVLHSLEGKDNSQ
jgi:hypothetical protein